MVILDQYSNLVDVRNLEAELFWTRYNVQIALNGGLIGVALTTEKESYVGLVPPWMLCVAGMSLTLIWVMNIIIGKLWIKRWEDQIREFEKSAQEQHLFPLFTNVRCSFKKSKLNYLFNIGSMALAIPFLFAIGWYALYRLQ